jgi:hypothetical protein
MTIKASKKPAPQQRAVPSPELQKEGDAILDLITRGEDEHWQIGWHFNRIVDEGLATKSGFKSAREYFDQYVRAVPKSTLMLYGAIARTFSEDVSKKYGVRSLRALMTYEHLTDAKLPKGDPGSVPIAVPQQGGSTQDKRFEDCTANELEAAIHYAQLPTDEPVPEKFEDVLDKVRKALQEVPGHNPLMVVSARPDPRTQMTVTIKLPIEHFDTLRDALELGFPKSDDEQVGKEAPRARPSSPRRLGARRAVVTRLAATSFPLEIRSRTAGAVGGEGKATN